MPMQSHQQLRRKPFGSHSRFASVDQERSLPVLPANPADDLAFRLSRSGPGPETELRQVVVPCGHYKPVRWAVSSRLSSVGTFAIWFRDELKKARYSQRSFAGAADVSKSAVGEWSRGTRVPDPENCKKIADTLDIGWDEVLTRAGHRDNTGEFPIDDPRQRVIDMVAALDDTDPAVQHWLKTAPLVLADLKQAEQEESQ